ncbi:MAG: helix-turn-helix transcriptional regulator [Erysipelotrichaceae bacterium]|nr:helix-turn-helix transcriptional regulator [Erysipelotrichaceae bacterium]
MSEKLTLAQKIRLRRKELGLTQQDLADMVGFTSKTAIAKIEAGERQINIHKINVFASALEVDASYLLDDFDDVNTGVDRIIVISSDGTKQNYVLTPKQMLELHELLNKFTIEAFNGELDESKPTFIELILGSKDAPQEVRLNKLYNILIMLDWDNIPSDIEPLIDQYCILANTTRKKIMDDAKRYKRSREKRGLPYPF